MSIKSRKEIEELKRQWENDPCWDLYDTEGFEEYMEELKEHQERMESIWDKKIKEKEKELDKKAEELEIKGLYRILLEHQEILQRHHLAIEALADGDNSRAYKVLQGYEV